jgi:hypothetical protein
MMPPPDLEYDPLALGWRVFGRTGQAASGAGLVSKAARRVKVNKLEVKDDERYEE